MGNNLDLCMVLNLPDIVECKTCNKQIPSDYDDYDIDCGEPNEVPGIWELQVYCQLCDNNNTYRYEVKINALH